MPAELNHEKAHIFFYLGEETLFDWWEDATLTSSILDATSGFDFSAANIPLDDKRVELSSKGLVEGAFVTNLIRQEAKTHRQIQGRIDEIKYDISLGGGSHVRVSGRDHMGPLVDGDLLPSIGLDGATFRDVALRALAQYGFGAKHLLISNDANRMLLTGKPAAGTTLSSEAPKDLATMKVRQAQPHPGETGYAFLSRHAKRLGLLIWGTGDGKIVIGRPNYEQEALYNFTCKDGQDAELSNVLAISRHRNAKHLPSEVHVYGKSAHRNWTKTDHYAKVVDNHVQGLGFHRILTVSDRNVKSKDEAIQRAKYEMSVRRQHADVLRVTVKGFAQGSAVFAPDTIADVDCPRLDARGAWYVTRREFRWSRGGGATTSLDLVPKGSIALGQAPFSDRQ